MGIYKTKSRKNNRFIKCFEEGQDGPSFGEHAVGISKESCAIPGFL